MKKTDFSSEDLNILRKLIGRSPDRNELRFMKEMHSSVVQQRPYFETIRRLDRGAKRDGISPAEVSLNNDTDLIISAVVNPGKEKRPLIDIPLVELLTRGFANILAVRIQVGKRFRRVKGSVYENEYFINSDNIRAEICFNSGIRYKEKDRIVRSVNEHLGNLYHARFASDDTGTEFKDFLTELGQSDSVLAIDVLNDKSFARAIYELSDRFQSGVVIEKILNPVSNRDKPSFLILIRSHSDSIFKSLFKSGNWDLEMVGQLIDGGELEVKSGKKDQSFNLPLRSFQYPAHLPDKYYAPSVEFKKRPVDPNELPETDNHSASVLELFNYVSRSVEPQSRMAGQRIKEISIGRSGDHTIAFAVPYNTFWCEQDPRNGGRIAVATGVRELVCRGYKPVSIALQNMLPDPDGDQTWKGIELLQGQEESVRFFDLIINHREITTDEDVLMQHLVVCGIPGSSNPITPAFKKSGDFISILGSHRGELGGSSFMKMKGADSQDHPLPGLDLSMDQRIQEAVQMGNSIGIIKSAFNVGCGGLSIAILKSLEQADHELGARIFVSRKLLTEELLYGETQGLIMITLDEGDIMEFERICIKVGVPSTTIGRVTNDGKLNINNVIELGTADIQERISL